MYISLRYLGAPKKKVWILQSEWRNFWKPLCSLFAIPLIEALFHFSSPIRRPSLSLGTSTPFKAAEPPFRQRKTGKLGKKTEPVLHTIPWIGQDECTAQWKKVYKKETMIPTGPQPTRKGRRKSLRKAAVSPERKAWGKNGKPLEPLYIYEKVLKEWKVWLIFSYRFRIIIPVMGLEGGHEEVLRYRRWC